VPVVANHLEADVVFAFVAPALVSQDVMVACAFAWLLIGFNGKNSALDQHAQPLRQQVARAIKHIQEVGKSCNAVQRFSKDQECPFLAHNLQGSSDWAVAHVMANALVHRMG
jgi:hypothetical protein